MQNKTTTTVTTPAAITPITLSMAKTFLRVDHSADDDLITLYIQAATEAAQKYTGRYFITTTLTVKMDRFTDIDKTLLLGAGKFTGHKGSLINAGDAIYLPFPPIQVINSIKTYSPSNTESTLTVSAYRLDTEYGRVYLNDGYTWPTDLRDYQAVSIEFDCGYGDDAEDVPAPIRQSILQHVNQLYACGGSCDMSDACKSLLNTYKLWDGFGYAV